MSTTETVYPPDYPRPVYPGGEPYACETVFWSQTAKQWIRDGVRADVRGFNSAGLAGTCAAWAVRAARRDYPNAMRAAGLL